MDAVHLARRDRIALAHRVIGAGGGLVLGAWAIATSRWDSPWVITAFVLLAIGGPVSYHLLTSIVRCPGCSARLSSFRIGKEASKRKLFRCDRCGKVAYLTEAFRWQRDVSG